jgi:hypothetical protein
MFMQSKTLGRQANPAQGNHSQDPTWKKSQRNFKELAEWFKM